MSEYMENKGGSLYIYDEGFRHGVVESDLGPGEYELVYDEREKGQ